MSVVFSPVTPVSSTNKTDRHDVTEILLKVALTTKIQIIYLLITQDQILKLVNNLFYFWQPICTNDQILYLTLSTKDTLNEQIVHQRSGHDKGN